MLCLPAETRYGAIALVHVVGARGGPGECPGDRPAGGDSATGANSSAVIAVGVNRTGRFVGGPEKH
ncbi:hypothetical protein TOK_5941 [Pseudonocardia sp. N23]|nr:hypothetical protein TOK_5941 [Pseudonocardia sp. N23]